MNPVLSTNANKRSYTVVGLWCQANNDTPYISWADPPPGMRNESWCNLKKSILEGRYLRHRLLSLVAMIVSAVVMVPTSSLMFDTDKKCQQEQAGGGGCPYAGATIAVILLVVYIGTMTAFHGQVDLDQTRRVIASYKPKLLQDGWDLKLTTKGRVLFVVGVLSITPIQYKLPTLNADRGTIV